METALIARILWERRRLRSHERLARGEIAALQAAGLSELRRFALKRSRFYQRFHRGLETAPLEKLPVLRKADLMASFDELVTDSDVRLDQVQEHLKALHTNERYLGRYWVSRTSGSTGHPGIFLANHEEWAKIIASYSRAQEWAGIEVSLTRRTRLAVVSSRIPWHQSARVGMSVDSPFIPVRRFDATQPLAEIVAGLNEWQPENLVAYASIANVLADEQISGRLRIAPRAVMCSSEVLTSDAASRIEQAWGRRPFNVYAATETAGIASECQRHRLHMYEDLVIPETVDEKNRAVPPGTPGAKVLVTVLFSRTQPLIRYEMSDRPVLSKETCDCGLPFGLLDRIEGRTEESLYLPDGHGKEVEVHPNVFHGLMETLPVAEWQIVQRQQEVGVLLVRPGRPIDPDQLSQDVTQALRRAGAVPPPVRVEIVETVERSSLGKAPLVKALQRRAHENHMSTGHVV